jgi:hypothetical protein
VQRQKTLKKLNRDEGDTGNFKKKIVFGVIPFIPFIPVSQVFA